ncbi:hypothetical protein [Brevibacterium sp.]|uniref:hypothetical protein n=1 Tax=Brevibacterium sp. TaxID=1701 RepID=UPI002647217C|nr:hypothetical protein [Brevibacterium sp.]MDN6159509.1 hypothetical protein [Brevibacterium sp.]MDN6605072.1 hypothetical protein [Brevibacterium sp.]
MSTDFIRQFRSQPQHRWFSPLLVVVLTAVFYGIGLIIQFGGFFVWAHASSIAGGSGR